jgi:hypothetical protein
MTSLLIRPFLRPSRAGDPARLSTLTVGGGAVAAQDMAARQVGDGRAHLDDGRIACDDGRRSMGDGGEVRLCRSIDDRIQVVPRRLGAAHPSLGSRAPVRDV